MSQGKEQLMADSVYKVIELVGTSTDSFEKAVANAVEIASLSLRDLRVAEVVQLDVTVEDGKVTARKLSSRSSTRAAAR
jgi:flavin-binding protein dodecin